MPDLIRCPACGEQKAVDDFPRNRASKNGRATYCKPCHNRICRENRIKNHGSIRQFHLRRRYGVDEAQVAWFVLQQDGVCAICRTGKAVHIDHDHRTGRVRGILCFNCNRALGKLGDDPELLRRALNYLEATAA
jgi:hypothetical protein